MGAGEIGEHRGEGHGSSSAHTRIDLVEDERIDSVGGTEDHLGREHHAADLAAGRDAPQRARGHARGGTVEQLDARGPDTHPLGARELLEGNLDLGPAHLETRHLCGDSGAEIGRRGTAHGVEMRSCFGERRLGGIDGGKRGPFALSPALDRCDDLLGSSFACEDALHVGTEAPQQALEG